MRVCVRVDKTPAPGALSAGRCTVGERVVSAADPMGQTWWHHIHTDCAPEFVVPTESVVHDYTLFDFFSTQMMTKC